MQEASLIPGTGDATAELHGCRNYHRGKGGRMAQKSGGSNRNDEIWKKLFTGEKKKKQSVKEGKWEILGVMQGLFIEPVLEGEGHSNLFYAWSLD